MSTHQLSVGYGGRAVGSPTRTIEDLGFQRSPVGRAGSDVGTFGVYVVVRELINH